MIDDSLAEARATTSAAGPSGPTCGPTTVLSRAAPFPRAHLKVAVLPFWGHRRNLSKYGDRNLGLAAFCGPRESAPFG
jgi:hypothetical protein